MPVEKRDIFCEYPRRSGWRANSKIFPPSKSNSLILMKTWSQCLKA